MNILRPKNGQEALDFLKQNKKIEVVNGYAFILARILEGQFSFSFKEDKWNKGWAGFERV